MADESQSRNSVSEIEDALWLLHSYESSRDDAGRVYSEADITRMVESVRSEQGPRWVKRGKFTEWRGPRDDYIFLRGGGWQKRGVYMSDAEGDYWTFDVPYERKGQ